MLSSMLVKHTFMPATSESVTPATWGPMANGIWLFLKGGAPTQAAAIKALAMAFTADSAERAEVEVELKATYSRILLGGSGFGG